MSENYPSREMPEISPLPIFQYTMVCKKSELMQECQGRPAKTSRGIKFWCFNCKRYVLTDEFHTVYQDEELIDSDRCEDGGCRYGD